MKKKKVKLTSVVEDNPITSYLQEKKEKDKLVQLANELETVQKEWRSSTDEISRLKAEYRKTVEDLHELYIDMKLLTDALGGVKHGDG